MDARWLGLISMRLHYFQAVAQKGLHTPRGGGGNTDSGAEASWI